MNRYELWENFKKILSVLIKIILIVSIIRFIYQEINFFKHLP